jgi:hypothetical protein
MRGVAALAVLGLGLGLAACKGSEAPVVAGAVPSDVQGWREVALRKPPTSAEFAALIAACRDRQNSGQSASLDQCLADLGLRRAP